MALRLLSSGAVDPTQTVLIEKAAPEVSVPTEPSREQVTFKEDTGDSVRLTAIASAPGLIVMSDVYDPGWKAYVDGKEAPIYVADGAFRAVSVPAGEHVIEFRYEPLTLRIGLIISMFFTLVSLGIVLGLGRRTYLGRKSPSVL
jgi:hypothetical protein